jgi:hypothetical protein
MNPLTSLQDNANLILEGHHEMTGGQVFREISRIKGEFELWTESVDRLKTDDWDLLEDLDASREEFLLVIDKLDDVFEVRDTSRPFAL